MTLDKEEHRAALLELIDATNFPGRARKLVMELATAIETATSGQDTKCVQVYAILADCIRSGQVPEADVPGILERDAEFAAWYRAKYGA